MALINKTGITNGGTIQAEHVTRAIDALSGGSTDTVVATGSFSGSFNGDGSQLTGVTGEWDGSLVGDALIVGKLSVTAGVTASLQGTASWASNAVTASYAVSASYEINYETSSSYADTSVSASYAINSTTADTAATASYVLNAVSSSFATSASRAISAATATSATSASYLNTLTQPTVTINSTASFNRNVLIGGTYYVPQQTITTTNATQTNIWNYGMSNGNAVAIEALVVGASASLAGGFTTMYSVAGNMVALCQYSSDFGSDTVGLTSSSFENFSGGDPSFGVTTDGIGGNKLYVWVKGLANTTIDWKVSIKYSEITAGAVGS